MSRVLDRSNGAWPPLDEWLGSRVERVEPAGKHHSLALVWRQPESTRSCRVVVPAPWVFSSCLVAVSSEDYGYDGRQMSDPDADLIGLRGARLTAVETDSRHLDLIFDSIRLSVGWCEP